MNESKPVKSLGERAPSSSHTRRYHGYDYSRGVNLFITASTFDRGHYFGEVKGGEIAFTELGREVERSIEAIGRLNPGVVIFGRVVMPNHVHFNLYLKPGFEKPLEVIGAAMRRFKSYTTTVARKTLGLGKLWQEGYHDHIASKRSFIDSTERYIAYNVAKWELMHNTPGSMAIHEPLFSPRLDGDDYWKGVGNTDLLASGLKMVSLRGSMQIKTPEDIAALVARMEKAVDMGYIILSGFISKAEVAVRDMLVRKPGARFIRILPRPLPNRAYRPESVYVSAFLENRYLEIAKGNEEVEFSRSACLDLNAEIVEIATAEEGFALRALPGGVLRNVGETELAHQDRGAGGAEPAHQDRGAGGAELAHQDRGVGGACVGEACVGEAERAHQDQMGGESPSRPRGPRGGSRE